MLASTFSTHFADLMDRLGERSCRRDLLRQAESYLRGLLSHIQRKNSWQLAEATGAETPHGFQRLLGRARWDADAVRDDLGCYVAQHLNDPQGVLIIDETGFLKKGNKSAGVSRQYSGTAGRIENCQIGVFMAYRSPHGHALIDRELYLPKCWIEDPARLSEAGIREDVDFATKPTLARRMLRRAFHCGLQVSWVTADEIYGRDSQFRKLLEKQGIGYVVAVSCQQRLFLKNGYGRVDEHAQEIPQQRWKELSCGAGSKGQRCYHWAFVPFSAPTDQGLPCSKLPKCVVAFPQENGCENAKSLAHKRAKCSSIPRGPAATKWSACTILPVKSSHSTATRLSDRQNRKKIPLRHDPQPKQPYGQSRSAVGSTVPPDSRCD